MTLHWQFVSLVIAAGINLALAFAVAARLRTLAALTNWLLAPALGTIEL
jgi:hypothetical protein